MNVVRTCTYSDYDVKPLPGSPLSPELSRLISALLSLSELLQKLSTMFVALLSAIIGDVLGLIGISFSISQIKKSRKRSEKGIPLIGGG